MGLLALGWMATLLLGAAVEGDKSGEVRVIPVEPTPEPNEVELRIAFPSKGEVKDENPVTVQFRLEAYPLGFYSDFLRAREVHNGDEGQAVHIYVDNKPFFGVNEAIDDITESEDIDFDQTIETTIPYKLSPGIHVIRAFPVRSFGESLKGSKCFAATYFYFGKTDKKETVDLSKPYLTYNQPQGVFKADKPILLDFFVANTQLSKDGYKVRLTIDGFDRRILTQWVPYYIYGLKPGSHTFQLELLNPAGAVIPPLFNDLERKVVVK